MSDDVRAELRAVVAQLEALSDKRDELIRAGIERKVRAVDLAEDAHLSVPRIYQIRDRRR